MPTPSIRRQYGGTPSAGSRGPAGGSACAAMTPAPAGLGSHVNTSSGGRPAGGASAGACPASRGRSSSAPVAVSGSTPPVAPDQLGPAAAVRPGGAKSPARGGGRGSPAHSTFAAARAAKRARTSSARGDRRTTRPNSPPSPTPRSAQPNDPALRRVADEFANPTRVLRLSDTLDRAQPHLARTYVRAREKASANRCPRVRCAGSADARACAVACTERAHARSG